MSVAVLSPCLLKAADKDEKQHYLQLANLLERLQSFTIFKIQCYRKAPYEGYKMEIPDYDDLYLNNLVKINIYGRIQKMLLSEYVDLEGYSPVTLPKEIAIEDDNELTKAFCCYLNYLHGKDSVLFIGEKSFAVPRPIELHQYKEDAFMMDASTYVKIELTDVLYPYLKEIQNKDDIFPRKEFCSNYNEYVTDKIKKGYMSQSEKNALFEGVGTTVAKYNEYQKDRNLSKMNTTYNKRRIVFKKMKGKKFYLSLDLESGGFEVFDNRYNHLGQFDFSCRRVKKPSQLTHKLLH